MLMDKKGSTRFRHILNLQVVSNEEGHHYFVYMPDDSTLALTLPLVKAGEILDGLYLKEIPFMILAVDEALPNMIDMGWDIYFSNVDDWEELLNQSDEKVMLFSESAHSLINNVTAQSGDTEDELMDGSMYGLDAERFTDFFEDFNLHCYFLPLGG